METIEDMQERYNHKIANLVTEIEVCNRRCVLPTAMNVS